MLFLMVLQYLNNLDVTHLQYLISPLPLLFITSTFLFLLLFPLIFSACDSEGPPSTPRLMYGLWKQCTRQVVILFALHLTGLS